MIDRTLTGGAPALIFRPPSYGSYTQNQRFRVLVTGLGGKTIEYETELISLEPIADLTCELGQTELTLAPGETAVITASVIPAWCDNPSVTYTSSDPSVAEVGEDGAVTARAEGSAVITAETVSGHSDFCRVTVTP